MSIEHDRLIFLALAGLSEVADAAGADPVEPPVSVRACLAFLYANSSGDRRCYDAFWQTLRRKLRPDENRHMAGYIRPTNARTELMGIARSVGIELTADRWQELRTLARAKAAA